MRTRAEAIRNWFAVHRKALGVQGLLVGVLLLLIVGFVSSMLSDCVARNLKPLFGLSRKQDLITFLAIGMGGVLLALQAVIAHRRSKAMEGNVEEQIKANRHTGDGLVQGRLRNAIEHLGHASDSVRLGGAYELFHLARDNENLRQTVLHILCAHIRVTTRRSRYRKKHAWEPSEEVQSLLELLFRRHHNVFDGLFPDLGGSWLNGAKLSGARLDRAWLRDAYLRGAGLSNAQLRRADLWDTELQGAYLMNARMDNATLYGAKLQGAHFDYATMRGVDLTSARLQGANLSCVQMQAASLNRTLMQGTIFNETQMQGVNRAPRGDRSQILRQYADHDSDFSTVLFSGGMNQDEVDDILKATPSIQRVLLEPKIQPHVGQTSANSPPSGVVSGRYTTEEAEQWTKDAV